MSHPASQPASRPSKIDTIPFIKSSQIHHFFFRFGQVPFCPASQPARSICIRIFFLILIPESSSHSSSPSPSSSSSSSSSSSLSPPHPPHPHPSHPHHLPPDPPDAPLHPPHPSVLQALFKRLVHSCEASRQAFFNDS